jgi:hypothetical protein
MAAIVPAVPPPTTSTSALVSISAPNCVAATGCDAFDELPLAIEAAAQVAPAAAVPFKKPRRCNWLLFIAVLMLILGPFSLIHIGFCRAVQRIREPIVYVNVRMHSVNPPPVQR